MKTNKKDAKTQNKIKNMQKCKTNLKKTKQYKTNYKQIQYKILKIEKRSKTIKKKCIIDMLYYKTPKVDLEIDVTVVINPHYEEGVKQMKTN